MTRLEKVKTQANLIMERNGGQAFFTFADCARILGCHPTSISNLLNEHGVLVRRLGKKKMVTALDLADVMFSSQESPFIKANRG